MERALAERDAGGAAAGAAAAATGAAAAAPATGAAAAPAGAAAAAAGVAPEERQCTAADLEKLKGQGLKQKHAAGTRGSSQTTREAQRIWKVVNFCIVRVRWRGARRSWLCETCGHLLCKQFRDH
mmetsp:Transcript_8860/g.27517  ORF Transcript_8860/g.27517 Transcript_8860/m.27517 type:complete len:125 (+) Transcript_8860:404-778(+)